MIFTHQFPIANSKEWYWYWQKHIESFNQFPNTDVYGGVLEFTKPLDYFDLDSDTVEKLHDIGKPYDIFDNPLPTSIPEFEVSIFDGVNDEDGIGALLWRLTNPERERQCYAFYASFFRIVNSIYCALTICYVDKDFGSELPAVIIEIGQDEGPYISPILVNSDAAELFSFDDMQALGEYLANVYFGIQYELTNSPEEIRVVEQRGPIEPDGEYHRPKGIVLVKRIIPVDRDGNRIEYGSKNSGRVYTMPAWNVRGHMRTLKDGRETPVRPYPKGPERNNPNAVQPKEYRFVDEKIDEDSIKR